LTGAPPKFLSTKPTMIITIRDGIRILSRRGGTVHPFNLPIYGIVNPYKESIRVPAIPAKAQMKTRDPICSGSG